MKTFTCPICKKEVDLMADFGEVSLSSDHYEYRIKNKKYHLRNHKVRKKLERKLETLREKIRATEKKLEFTTLYDADATAQ